MQQKILFTLYSKAEALEMLGRGGPDGKGRFRRLLQRQYPDIKLDWTEIDQAIEANLEVLPETYEYRAQRMQARFRGDLCAFARQLILADPRDLTSAADLLREHAHELQYLAGLIAERLELREQKENEWNADNTFCWRFALQGRDVPQDTEESAAELYRRGEHEKAEAVFRLLIDCFDGYAEGYNYLGLIALEQRKLDLAIERFRKTIELGRKLFPARIRKDRYWSDHATRPYMRGLRNLTLTLNEAGHFEEALALCDRLESECGDDVTATWHRATANLNMRRWRQAEAAAERSMGLDPTGGFLKAFACFEQGHREDALAAFLHAALNHPGTVPMLTGKKAHRGNATSSREEVQDHNTGVSLLRSLHAYLKGQSPASKRFFRGLTDDARITRLLDESTSVVRRWHEEHRTENREAFDRMQRMHSLGFAAAEASKLHDLVAAHPVRPGVALH